MKQLLSSLLFTVALLISAFTALEAQTLMRIHLNDGSNVDYQVSNIDSITWLSAVNPDNPEIARTGIKVGTKLDNFWFGLDGNEFGWDAMVFHTGYPMNNHDVEAIWKNSTLAGFLGNDITWGLSSLNSNGHKFFFIPQNTIVKVCTNPYADRKVYEEWVITPAYGDQDVMWKSLLCENDEHYIWPLVEAENASNLLRVYKNLDSQKLGDATANDKSITDLTALDSLMKWCNIAYNAGAFNNVNLYAVKKSDYHNCEPLYNGLYTKIAEINPFNGDVKLVRTWTGNNVLATNKEALDLLLNAIGYDAYNANISKQLHAWTGAVAENGSNVAAFSFLTEDANHQDFAIWESSWQRPINFFNDKVVDDYEFIRDNQSNGYFIPIYDLLAFYDWRGPVAGDMEAPENKWLWAYYNINRVEVDLNTDHITTDLNGGTLGRTPLSNLTGMIRLYPATAAQLRAVIPSAQTKTFETLIGGNTYGYNQSNASSYLVEYLEGPSNGKANFGYIYYENNGLNVTNFTVRIPLTIYYAWGHLKTYVDVLIKDPQQGR